MKFQLSAILDWLLTAPTAVANDDDAIVTSDMSQPQQDYGKTEPEKTAADMSQPQEGDNTSQAQIVTDVSHEKDDRPKSPVEELQSGKFT